MEVFTLFIALVALIISILAYQRTGGMVDARRPMDGTDPYMDLKKQVESLGTLTDALREKTADALERLEKVLRRTEKGE